MAVSVVPNLELLGRAPPEKTINPETPNTQNSFEFPHLKEAENHPKKGQGNKRKKSNETSPPGNPKKKGTRLPEPSEAAASILDEVQTQLVQREEGSGAVGSSEPVGHPTRARRRTSGPHTGVKTRLQKRKEEEVIGMEEAKDRIAATQSNPPDYLDGEPENRIAAGKLPSNLSEYQLNPTYSGNFNQITRPCAKDFTENDEVRDSVYFWNMYKDKIVPDEPDNSRATMDSLCRIQNVQKPELRDRLQDPAIRSGIYAEVLKDEVEKVTKRVITTTYQGLRASSEEDSGLLKDGKYEEYHEKSMKNMLKMVQTGMDAVIGVVVPKLGGSTEYNQAKLQDTQIAVNKLLETVGGQQERLNEIEQNVAEIDEKAMTKDDMITWTKSMQNADQGVVVKNAPWATVIVDQKTPYAKKTALVKEVNDRFKTNLTTNDINAVKLSIGGGTKYGDMMQIFFARREAIKEIMDVYFKNLYINGDRQNVDTAYRNSVGKWERYKSKADIENGKKFARIKEETYPELLKIYNEAWETEEDFKKDVDRNPMVVAERIKNFTIPIYNGNKASNLGADRLTVNLPKNCTKQQKLSYQQRFVNAVKDAKRWKEWSLKQAKRQEDDQKRKSENFSQMVMRGRQQTESEDVMNIST